MEMETILEPVKETELTTLEEGQAYLSNQSVLEKLSVDDKGNLLFDGVKLIKERKTAVWETEDAFNNGLMLGYGNGDASAIYDIQPGIIPINAEIKSIELKWDDIYGFIDIREINAKDTDGMYAVVYHRAIVSEYYSDNSQYLFTVLTDDATSSPGPMYLMFGLEEIAIRVTYYVED